MPVNPLHRVSDTKGSRGFPFLKGPPILRQDRTSRILLAVIAFLLGANLLSQIHSDRKAEAAGGIPDSGAQLQAQIEQLTALNAKVDKLTGFLESGKLKVVVTEMPKADK
jgi:hypothetical protein